MAGVAAYGMVEEQRMGIGDEEGQRGLVVEDIGGHVSTLALADIGRVAHNDIPEMVVVGGLEHVLLAPRHLGTEAATVLGSHLEGLGRHVPRRDPGLEMVERGGNGYAARAGTYVEHAERPRKAAGHHGQQQLGLGTGDEHTGAHAEGSPAEVGLSQHILHGLRLFEPPHKFL